MSIEHPIEAPFNVGELHYVGEPHQLDFIAAQHNFTELQKQVAYYVYMRKFSYRQAAQAIGTAYGSVRNATIGVANKLGYPSPHRLQTTNILTSLFVYGGVPAGSQAMLKDAMDDLLASTTRFDDPNPWLCVQVPRALRDGLRERIEKTVERWEAEQAVLAAQREDKAAAKRKAEADAQGAEHAADE